MHLQHDQLRNDGHGFEVHRESPRNLAGVKQTGQDEVTKIGTREMTGRHRLTSIKYDGKWLMLKCPSLMNKATARHGNTANLMCGNLQGRSMMRT